MASGGSSKWFAAVAVLLAAVLVYDFAVTHRAPGPGASWSASLPQGEWPPRMDSAALMEMTLPRRTPIVIRTQALGSRLQASYRGNLTRLLVSAGHVVESASSGHDAVAIADHFKADVLVVDWMLRNSLDGLEVVEQLARKVPGLATVLITGYPSRELRAKASDHGVYAFLEKPFRTGELLEAIERARELGPR